MYPIRIDQHCNTEKCFNTCFFLSFSLFIYSALVAILSNVSKIARRNLVDKGFKRQLNSDLSYSENDC